MDTFTKIGLTFCVIMSCFSMYMTYHEITKMKNEENAKRIWVNKEHTACHFQDTLEVNGVKYIKVFDKDNSGYYGDPYLVPIK